MKMPVLIIGYLRPQNVSSLLEICYKDQRRTFIFIDFCSNSNYRLNLEVLSIANFYSSKMDLTIKFCDSNIGVKSAVKVATSWAFQFVDNLIVLEDDSKLNDYSLSFFDENIYKLEGNIMLISGRSPREAPSTENCKFSQALHNVSFPMTNGWATTQVAWSILSVKRDSNEIFKRIFRIQPIGKCKRRVMHFFTAGVMNYNRKKGKSCWDSLVAYNLLLSGGKCIVPNVNSVGNNGLDLVASNTHKSNLFLNNDYISISPDSPSKIHCNSQACDLGISNYIALHIYGIRLKHIFSPFKAYCNLIFDP